MLLCSKILLNVLHNISSTVLLPWQQTRFQTSSILNAFSAHLCRATLILANAASYAIYIIQQVYKCVNSSLRPRLACFELKISNILKSNSNPVPRVSHLPARCSKRGETLGTRLVKWVGPEKSEKRAGMETEFF